MARRPAARHPHFVNAPGAEATFLNFHSPDGGFAAYMRGEAEASTASTPPADGGLPAALATHVAVPR